MKQLITLSNLPSKGEYYKDPNHLLKIPLYTFKDILSYNNYSVHNYLQGLFRDIDTLNIEGSDDILLFDLPALSFLKKCMSIKEDININFNFTCSECDHEFLNKVNLSSIDFKSGLDLDESIIIENEKFEIKIPTLFEVKQILKIFLGFNYLPHYEIFLLCCYLRNDADLKKSINRVKHVVENSTKENVVKLLNLVDNFDPLLPNKIKCKQCEKESVVKLSALTTDLFSLFRINY